MTSDLHTSIRDRNHALHRGEISAQRPPPSLSTGLGNLAYRGTSELKIRNVTVYPVACRKSVNTGLSRNAHCSGAPHSCASLKKNPPPIHIATPGRQRTDSMQWRSCAIHHKVLGVTSVALFCFSRTVGCAVQIKSCFSVFLGTRVRPSLAEMPPQRLGTKKGRAFR